MQEMRKKNKPKKQRNLKKERRQNPFLKFLSLKKRRKVQNPQILQTLPKLGRKVAVDTVEVVANVALLMLQSSPQTALC
jgi:hypothetical protein